MSGAAADKQGYFWRIVDGSQAQPPVAVALGAEILEADPAGTVRIRYEGTANFANPAGFIQGGILAAMLDDAMSSALAATLGAGEFAPTLNLNLSFVRPANPGPMEARAWIGHKGKSLGVVNGELRQDGKLLVTATATATIQKPQKPA